MAKRNSDAYSEEIQERMDGDVFKAMLEGMARRVMAEKLALHVGAVRHERTPERKGHRNAYQARSLKTRAGIAGDLRGDVFHGDLDAQGQSRPREDGRLRTVGGHGLLRGAGTRREAHGLSPAPPERADVALSDRGHGSRLLMVIQVISFGFRSMLTPPPEEG